MSKIFAPYFDSTAYDNPGGYVDINTFDVTTIILAFMNYYVDPTTGTGIQEWTGNADYKASFSVPSQTLWQSPNIKTFQKNGGNVIISFGGQANSDIAQYYGAQVRPATTEHELDAMAESIASAYAVVIDSYNLTTVDFDIEGDFADWRLTQNSIQLRNRALVNLKTQSKYKNLSIHYTLPVGLTGLTTGLSNPPTNNIQILQDAKACGLQIDVVNIMTMAFGGIEPYTTMYDACSNAAKATKAQIESIGLTCTIGITPFIVNDSPPFTIDDAKNLVTFANETDYVTRLSFWNLNLDADMAFTKIFNTFGKVSKGSKGSNVKPALKRKDHRVIFTLKR